MPFLTTVFALKSNHSCTQAYIGFVQISAIHYVFLRALIYHVPLLLIAPSLLFLSYFFTPISTSSR